MLTSKSSKKSITKPRKPRSHNPSGISLLNLASRPTTRRRPCKNDKFYQTLEKKFSKQRRATVKYVVWNEAPKTSYARVQLLVGFTRRTGIKLRHFTDSLNRIVLFNVKTPTPSKSHCSINLKKRTPRKAREVVGV